MSSEAPIEDEPVGYRKPPVSSRFRKGQSGNPRGRPRGSRQRLPYDAVLGQLVTIREDGVERRVTAAEAFLLHVAKRGLEGDGPAARAAMAAIEEARARQGGDEEQITVIIWKVVGPGRVNSAMQKLKMARKLNPYSDSARMQLEPWIVQRALARLGSRRLSLEEQHAVVQATRTPGKVQWPDWWEVSTAGR